LFFGPSGHPNGLELSCPAEAGNASPTLRHAGRQDKHPGRPSPQGQLAGEQRVVISIPEFTLQLWIGKNTAMVQGRYTVIDSSNPNVMPFIQPPGRTMMPLRFIAENLGRQVDWLPETSEVQVTYPAP
jgi:hypothetical protein